MVPVQNSHHSLVVEGAREHSGVSFIKALILDMRVPPPHDLPKASPSDSITLGIRSWVYEFGEDTSIPTIMREGPWSTEGAGHSSLFLEAVQASLLPGAPHQLSQQISYINSSQAILGNP